MPSIIPGYEYDIFISYRQNDNKRDGWVTEFVMKMVKLIMRESIKKDCMMVKGFIIIFQFIEPRISYLLYKSRYY